MQTMSMPKQKSKIQKVVLSDVPGHQLSKIVSSYKRDGALKVEVDVQKDEKYSVTAHFIKEDYS